MHQWRGFKGWFYLMGFGAAMKIDGCRMKEEGEFIGARREKLGYLYIGPIRGLGLDYKSLIRILASIPYFSIVTPTLLNYDKIIFHALR